MATPRTVWLVSPYHTGSHRAWARGYESHSGHTIQPLTMAGRFWKWRMQGGAMALAIAARDRLAAGETPDAIIVTDMLNLPAWLGLLRRDLPAGIPIALYMHENQLTYPWRPGEKPDFTYAMINWLSQLAADVVVFNSAYHMEGWFDELPKLLKHFPDYNHLSLVDEVRAKSRVLPVGIEAETIAIGDVRQSPAQGKPPLILWNQRWEYDKRPDLFFELLYQLQAEGLGFQLAVAGENFRNVPEEFTVAQERLAGETVHWGYLPEYVDYIKLLRRADLVISTAEHEFFGISVLEAIIGGAFPLLPRRLSYPELIPDALHAACLYGDEHELIALARARLRTPRRAPPSLRRHVIERFDWSTVAGQYDALVDELTVRSERFSAHYERGSRGR